jgi:ABC-type lipoprotein release transport system permease subunit
VPIVLTSAAVLAVWIPATRASRLDPVQALREE